MHILVIDDESIIRETMASILDLEGHRVTLAADGERGIELFTSCRYDLVFDRSRHARPVRVGSRRGSEATPDRWSVGQTLRHEDLVAPGSTGDDVGLLRVER